MKTVNATHLKNRLGEVLEQAAVSPVAVARHGRIVAYLVPAARGNETQRANAKSIGTAAWGRHEEERVVALCASGDFRPSRWARAGDPQLLAGVAAMLASASGFDRPRMLALAERLYPGMSSAQVFGRWLARSPVDPARFLPMLRARLESSIMRARAKTAP